VLFLDFCRSPLTHTHSCVLVPLQLQSLPQSTSQSKRGGLATAKLSDIRLLRWRPNDNSRRRLRQRQSGCSRGNCNNNWHVCTHMCEGDGERESERERGNMGDYDTTRCQKLWGSQRLKGASGG